MMTTTWTAAPAGFLRVGGSDVRPSGHGAGAEVCYAVATAGADARLRPARASLVPAQEQRRIAPTRTAQNDGTTLGIHSPGRPQS
jgi:hypothetical protein